MARTRQAIKPLNLDSKTVARGAKAEQERKAASKAALAHAHNLDVAQREIDRRSAEGEDMTGALIDPQTYAITKPTPPVDVPRETAGSAAVIEHLESLVDDRHAAERAAALETARADAEATGVSFEEMLESMGIDETGAPVEPEAKQGYDGPMVALKTARLHYVKAANGILCNGDPLATVCGAHTREETVRALIIALKLPGNPYLALNPGQQSMNLRNKARHALKNGTLTMTEINAAFEAK